MFYGVMIDSTCELYQPTCEDKSVCLQYNNNSFRYYLHGVTNAFIVLAVVFMVISYSRLRKMDFSHLEQPAEEEPANGESKVESTPMVVVEEKA